MSKGLFYLLLPMGFLFYQNIQAQQQLVTGIITDAGDGIPVPGVTVAEKGTNNGVSSDFDGNYSIEVDPDATLVFSMIGYSSQEIPVDGRRIIDVAFAISTESLSEVVITALGIKRDEKTLTYANQQVDGDDLTRARTTNIGGNLSGRVAGLDVKQSSSGAGGSTKMVLRGNKSLSGGSQPLFVIDGIPMANNRGTQPDMWGGTDRGDGLSQINQDDIESITILKGANASVLYGSEGANGVVLITTKSGREGVTSVTINSGLTFSTVTGIPDLQFRYGSEDGAKESWSYTQGDYADGYVEDFFDTGVNAINSVSVSGGNNITTAYFSFSNISASGNMPTNKYLKNNVTFKQSTKLFKDKVTLSSNTILAYEKTRNRTPAGYYLNPLTGLYFFPRDRDFEQFRNYENFDTGRNMNLQNWFVEDHHQSNPFWILNRQPLQNHSRRLITSLNLEYDITEELSFQVRGNYDFALKSYEQRHAAGSNATNTHRNGRWDYTRFTDNLMYTDAILNYTTNFGDFSLTTIAGASYQKTEYGEGVDVNTGTNGLLYPNEFNFQNIANNVQVQSVLGSRAIKQGAFVTANLGYREMVFLDLAGRQDWASTLAGTGNETYFYPAVGVSALVSEIFALPAAFTFAKLRASYSSIANEVPFNVVNPQNTISPGGGVVLNPSAPFTNLSPEIITSLEFGLDLRFFQNRFGLDFTYYNINSQDQFITLPAPSGSQYINFFVNAGEIVNKGIELAVYATPIRTDDLDWRTSFNFSKNDNEVVELHPELTEPISLGNSEGYQSKIVPGGSIGDLYVYKFQRDDQDRIILENGIPLKTPTTEFVGNSNPDWNLGWNNTVTYKDFSLMALVDGKFGGKVISQTEAMLDGYGVSERSAVARDNGGVSINGVEDGQAVSSVDPRDWFTAIGDRNGIKEAYVYDRTNVRLSQVSLSYSFGMEQSDFFRDVTLSFVGQNLFFLYKKAPYDPELAMSTGTSFQSLDNFNMPATSTYGLNLTLNF
jgi:TonB-linked SusC/RagA family outer membrane protein